VHEGQKCSENKTTRLPLKDPETTLANKSFSNTTGAQSKPSQSKVSSPIRSTARGNLSIHS